MTESVRSEICSEVISTASEDDITSAYSDTPFELPEGAVFAQLHAPPVPGFDVKTKVCSHFCNSKSIDSKLLLRISYHFSLDKLYFWKNCTYKLNIANFCTFSLLFNKIVQRSLIEKIPLHTMFYNRFLNFS